MKLILELDRICRKNNIGYALCFGSALGLYNYGGFIPWDDDMDVAIDYFDVPRLVEALKERFGGEWKILLRYHDNDKKKEKTQNKLTQDCVIDVTDLPDIQELLSFVDCGITDYSSWIYDFVLSGKPGFIYARDVDVYNNERGFYFKLEESPFPVAKSNDEMMQKVRSFDEDLYAKRVKEFLDGKECMDDGHASERIADRLMKLLG